MKKIGFDIESIKKTAKNLTPTRKPGTEPTTKELYETLEALSGYALALGVTLHNVLREQSPAQQESIVQGLQLSLLKSNSLFIDPAGKRKWQFDTTINSHLEMLTKRNSSTKG